MTSAHPTLTSLFIAAYWDLNRVLRTLWRPTLIAFLILLACVPATPIIGLLPGLLFKVISGVLVVAGSGFIALTLVLVTAARLYQAFGDRLKRAP